MPRPRERRTPYLASAIVSLGITFNRPAEIPPDDLFRNADVALYRAKHAGGSQYTIYDEDHVPAHISTDELRATYS